MLRPQQEEMEGASMTILILGLAIFIGAHLIPTFPEFRAAKIAQLGANGYKLLFTAASLIGLILIVLGVAAARGSAADIQLWNPPLWTRHLAFLLMAFAFILLVATYIPSKIRDKVRHPMLAAVKLWALAHLLANGDLIALLLFGALLAYAVYDRISVKRRGGPAKPAASGWAGDALAIALGLGLWALTLFWLHPLAGVPLLMHHS
jgi:uncharacterized membrane protein